MLFDIQQAKDGLDKIGSSALCYTTPISLHPLQIVSIVGKCLEIVLARYRIRYSLFRGLHGLLISKHFVDIPCVVSWGHSRFVGCRHSPISQILPIDVSEEGVTHYVAGIIRGGAQSFGLVSVQQARQQWSSLRWEMSLHLHRNIHNVIHHLLTILLVVRRSTA